MGKRMVFRGFRPLSLVDYPGKVCAIVFTGGCNFRCPWCYVKDLVIDYTTLPRISENYVLRFLKERKEWLDALVISGGEPTIHPELPDFIRKVKELNPKYLVGLETNGTNPQMLYHLIKNKLIDYVEMDVKAPLDDPELYSKVTGIEHPPMEKIKESVHLIMKMKKYAFRTTIVPTLHTVDNVVRIAKSIKGAKRYYLQQFRPMNTTIDDRFYHIKPYPYEKLVEMRKKCQRYVSNTVIRGV